MRSHQNLRSHFSIIDHLSVLPFDSRTSVKMCPVRFGAKPTSSEERPRIFSSKKWVYDDKHFPVVNPIKQMIDHAPHLILKDSGGVPRFVLGYNISPKSINVFSIQRVRNEYNHSKGGHVWSPDLERVASQKLRAHLGVFPSEYLFTQFLRLYRNRIRSGQLKVTLTISDVEKEIYDPIINKFFLRTPIGKNIYELNFNRNRVKEVLGLK